MSQTTPPSNADSAKAEDIPLEDIDKILAAEDPEFTKSLEEVRSVETDQSVTIEASAIDETAVDDPAAAANQSQESAWRRGLLRARLWWMAQRLRAKAAIRDFLKNALIWLKVKPKEFALYAIVLVRLGLKKAVLPVVAFRNAERAQKLTILALLVMVAASLWILVHNIRGIWLPQLNEPILRQFAAYADSVETYDPKDGGESFYSAFPQERYEFLFRKMKVNLRRTPENPLPMGAFEIIVTLDSKDTAIEVSDREVEFWDLVQRVFEDETFADLETELGKNKLKSRLKREMNQKLTQGWVKEVDFKTFILKP